MLLRSRDVVHGNVVVYNSLQDYGVPPTEPVYLSLNDVRTQNAGARHSATMTASLRISLWQCTHECTSTYNFNIHDATDDPSLVKDDRSVRHGY